MFIPSILVKKLRLLGRAAMERIPAAAGGLPSRFIAACRQLRNSPDTKHIPVFFVSSKQQKADRVWAQMQGAKGLIGKPFNAREVLETLAAL